MSLLIEIFYVIILAFSLHFSRVSVFYWLSSELETMFFLVCPWRWSRLGLDDVVGVGLVLDDVVGVRLVLSEAEDLRLGRRSECSCRCCQQRRWSS